MPDELNQLSGQFRKADVRLLFVTRFVRMFAYGFLSVLLVPADEERLVARAAAEVVGGLPISVKIDLSQEDRPGGLSY